MLDVGGGPLQSHGSHDVFMSVFDHDGDYRLAAGFGDSDNQIATGVAMGNAGQCVWSGTFRSTVTLGDHLLTTTGSLRNTGSVVAVMSVRWSPLRMMNSSTVAWSLSGAPLP